MKPNLAVETLDKNKSNKMPKFSNVPDNSMTLTLIKVKVGNPLPHHRNGEMVVCYMYWQIVPPEIRKVRVDWTVITIH